MKDKNEDAWSTAKGMPRRGTEERRDGTDGERATSPYTRIKKKGKTRGASYGKEGGRVKEVAREEGSYSRIEDVDRKDVRRVPST